MLYLTTYFDKNRSYCPDTGEGVQTQIMPYNIGKTRVFPTNDGFSNDLCGTATNQSESFENLSEPNENLTNFFIFIIVTIFLIYFFNKK